MAGGWAAAALVSVPRRDYFSAVQRVRDEVKSAYVQAIDSDRVLNANHLFLALQNVVSAHRHGYNKMNRVDSELLLVIAGVNNFEVAVKRLAPRAGSKAVLLSFSDRKEDVLRSMELLERYGGATVEQFEFTNDSPRLLRLSSFYEVPRRGTEQLSEDELTRALVERSAVFYAKYR